MKSRKPFLLRISPTLYEALEAWAQQELRSVNGQIEYILQEAVRRRGRAVEKDKNPKKA
ncbi:MAG: ribbon-helix-helix domain-containing protein [Thermoguttaceae bacterium]